MYITEAAYRRLQSSDKLLAANWKQISTLARNTEHFALGQARAHASSATIEPCAWQCSRTLEFLVCRNHRFYGAGSRNYGAMESRAEECETLLQPISLSLSVARSFTRSLILFLMNPRAFAMKGQRSRVSINHREQISSAGRSRFRVEMDRKIVEKANLRGCWLIAEV